MSDPLEKVSSGEPLVFRADTWNALIDAAKFVRDRFGGQLDGPQNRNDPLVPAVLVYIKNTIGGSLLAHSPVVPSGATPIDPTVYPLGARRQPVFEVNAPGSDTDLVFITQGPIDSGKLGLAAVAGVTVAAVNVTNSTHRFARPVAGNYVSLESADTGSVKILGPFDTGNATRLVLLNSADAIPAGGNWKSAVRAATVAAGTLATDFHHGSVIDGVTIVTGDRILIKNQSFTGENGIWVVNFSGAPTRAIDADVMAKLVGAVVFVNEGTANKDTIWACINDSAGLFNPSFAIMAPTWPTVKGEAGAGPVTLPNVHTFSFDHATGFQVTIPTPADPTLVKVELLPASGSQNGAMTTGGQAFGGDKSFGGALFNLGNCSFAQTPAGKVDFGPIIPGSGLPASPGSGVVHLDQALASLGASLPCMTVAFAMFRDTDGTVAPGFSEMVFWNRTTGKRGHWFDGNSTTDYLLVVSGAFAVGNPSSLSPGITATKTVKDGSGVNQTVTITGGIITGWT